VPDLDRTLLKIRDDVVEVLCDSQQGRVNFAGMISHSTRTIGLLAVIAGVVHAVQTTGKRHAWATTTKKIRAAPIY
jgi:hypothetical protein